MNSRSGLAKILGLTYRQVRDRIDALDSVDGLLAGQVRRGPNGRLEYSIAVLEMLKRLATLADTPGKSLRQAAELVGHEVRKDTGLDTVDNALGKEVNPHVKELLKEKDRLIQRLESENAFLREQVDRLLPLALPPPRHRWFAWLWPARGKAVLLAKEVEVEV